MIEVDYFNPEVLENSRFEEVEKIIIDFLHNSGKLVSLSVSNDEAILWVVLKAYSEEEVIKTINSIPLDYDLSYDYYFLNHYEIIQEIGSFSLN